MDMQFFKEINADVHKKEHREHFTKVKMHLSMPLFYLTHLGFQVDQLALCDHGAQENLSDL